MKFLHYRRNIGILLSILLLIPFISIFLNINTTNTGYYTTSATNSNTLIIKNSLTLYVPTPIFHPDNATLDIVGIIATDTETGYQINDTTVKSTYFEIFNYTSKQSIGIYGNLVYNLIYSDWRNVSIDLSSYQEGLFYIFVNISSNDVPEGVAANSSPFELVHKIIISGISIHYTAGFQQTLNITVGSANSTYRYHSPINSANYRFYFQNNKTVVLNPNLAGNLTSIGIKWQVIANLSKLPVGGYYVVVNFADLTAANSKGSSDTTNFTVVHSLNISTPIINYINNMNQILNISCYANSSYYYDRNLNSPSMGIGQYRIYLNNGTPTSISGSLNWNGKEWTVNNADISLLPKGSYRVKCQFSTYYAETSSPFSNDFNITHKIIISSPTIIFNNHTKYLNIYHVNVLSSYSTHGYLTNLTAVTHSFELFDASNHSKGISGQLSWNGTEWQLVNFPIPSLSEGSYYVKLYFNDSQTSLTEISSNIFVASYPETPFDWVIAAIILLVVLAIGIVLFWTFFTETPIKRGKEPEGM
ncbi:MAG: hypothetical protein ACFFD2_22970 [Promethearchaeota archaeon]